MAASSAAPLANARPARERGRAASTRLASLPLLLPLLPLLGLLAVLLLLHAPTSVDAAAIVAKRSYSDQSVRGYLTERACWWNEICKEEFQTQFRCKCPQWSYCRSPGRYYNAYCTVTGTGYIWTQPGWGGSAAAAAPAAAAGA